jgi:hypothetical protein
LRLDDEALRVLPHSGIFKNREQYGAKVRMENSMRKRPPSPRKKHLVEHGISSANRPSKKYRGISNAGPLGRNAINRCLEKMRGQ